MKIAVVVKSNIGAEKEVSALVEGLKNDPSFDVCLCASSDIPRDSNRILVFGGDGTVLDVVRVAAKKDISAPILGVNMGNLGFLTAFEKDIRLDDLKRALMLSSVRQLPLIEASVGGSDKGYALNDAVIKTEGARPIYLNLSINGKYVDSYRGDGVIVSTATGSTAYSLSAGGPVLAPDLDAFVINPICAHTLHSRPLVVSADSAIEIEIRGDSAARVSLDGNAFAALVRDKLSVKIARSNRSATFADVGERDFYGKLLKKMNVWGRTERQDK